MGFKKKVEKNDAGDYEVPPAGSQPAVLVGLLNLGTKDYSFKGQVNHQHRVFLIWELVGEEKKTDGKPFVVAQDFTFSMKEKSAMRKMVERVTGKTYKDGEEVDLEKWVSRPFVLSIVHKVSGEDKTYAKIEGVNPVQKGQKIAKATISPLIWDFDGPLPTQPWIPFIYGQPHIEIIQASDEWKSRIGAEPTPAGNGQKQTQEQDEDQPIPY